MPLYKLHLEDGTDAGEARYADWIKPREEVHVNGTVGHEPSRDTAATDAWPTRLVGECVRLPRHHMK